MCREGGHITSNNSLLSVEYQETEVFVLFEWKDKLSVSFSCLGAQTNLLQGAIIVSFSNLQPRSTEKLSCDSFHKWVAWDESEDNTQAETDGQE